MSDDSDSAPVLWEQRGGLVILRLNRPDAMNALTLEIKNALNEFVPRFFADPECRCLMITGTGRAFCAGGDVRNMKGEQVPAEVRARLTISHNGWARDILQGEKPVVMAVNGPAVGAGFGLAMLGDIVLASGVVAREASQQGKSLPDHVAHLIVHGILHLLGHDHEDDDEADRMERLETEILKGLGISDPYERQ